MKRGFGICLLALLVVLGCAGTPKRGSVEVNMTDADGDTSKTKVTMTLENGFFGSNVNARDLNETLQTSYQGRKTVGEAKVSEALAEKGNGDQLVDGMYAIYQGPYGFYRPGFPGYYSSAGETRSAYFTAWAHWRSRGGPRGGWWKDRDGFTHREPPPGREPTAEEILNAPPLP